LHDHHAAYEYAGTGDMNSSGNHLDCAYKEYKTKTSILSFVMSYCFNNVLVSLCGKILIIFYKIIFLILEVYFHPADNLTSKLILDKHLFFVTLR